MTRWKQTEHIVEGFAVAVEVSVQLATKIELTHWQMMEMYKSIPGAAVDPDLTLQMVRGAHASLCGNGKPIVVSKQI